MQVDRAQQRAITRLCIQCGLFCYSTAPKVRWWKSYPPASDGRWEWTAESAISSNAIVLTTIKDGECLTSTRKNVDRGINMHVVTEVQHIVILAEHKLLDYRDVEKRFAQIVPLRYPRWLLVLMVGFSCACFCKLNNGGWDGALVSFAPVRRHVHSPGADPPVHASADQLLHYRVCRHHHLRAAVAPAGLPAPQPLPWLPASCCWFRVSFNQRRRRYV
jgi:hypothetical protein